jgi:hypothetical protein
VVTLLKRSHTLQLLENPEEVQELSEVQPEGAKPEEVNTEEEIEVVLIT